MSENKGFDLEYRTCSANFDDPEGQARSADLAVQALDEVAREEDPISVFESQVETMTAGGLSKAEAIREIVATNPELHRQYVQAVNLKAVRSRDEFYAQAAADREQRNPTR